MGTKYDPFSELEKKYKNQKDPFAELAEKYSQENNEKRTQAVTSWADRFNKAIQGVTDYTKQRNGGYTLDASGGYGAEINSLISDYEGIREYADRFGLLNSHRYLQQLQDLKKGIERDNAYYAQWGSQEAYDAYEKYVSEIPEAGYFSLPQSAYTQDVYENWKSRVRDASTIQQQIDDLIGELNTAKSEAEVLADSDEARESKQTYIDLYDKLTATEYENISPEAMARIQQDVLNQINAVADPSKNSKVQQLQSQLDLLKEELEWRKYLDYADLMQADDFTEKSQYKPQVYTKPSASEVGLNNYTDEASGWEDPLYEAINGNTEAQAWLSNQGANYYGSEGGGIGALLGRTTYDKSELQQMTEDEVKIFNYLYATQGTAAAHAYYDYLESGLTYRERQEMEEKYKARATEHPVLASIEAIVTSPLKGLSYAGQVSDYLPDGTIDENAGYNVFSYANTAVREQVSSDVEKKWGEVGSYAYNLGMSMGDFVTSTVAGGGSQLSLLIMGTGAAADTVIAAKDRGLSDNQAFTLGTIAGAAEIVTEKISLDALLDKTGMGKSAVTYILKNMLAEASEEGASNLINTVADVLISKDKSQWQLSINAYVEDGYTESEAFVKAMEDQAVSLGLDVLGGALSGSVISSVSVAGSKVTNTVSNMTETERKRANLQQVVVELSGGKPVNTAQNAEITDAANNLQTESDEATSSFAEDLLDIMDPVKSAVNQYQQTGTVSNRLANYILRKSDAVSQLQTAVGLELPVTNDGKRQAVKDAVVALAAQRATETHGQQKNTIPDGTAVTVSSGSTALTQSNKEKNTLAYQLASSIDAVRDMEPVSQLTGTELNERGTKLSDQIRKFFKSIGNKVTRTGLGDVELGEYGVGGMLNHRPVNRAKAVSLAAVPDVIRSGKQISYDSNWKGRGYESYTFAAPVTVNGTTVYVAAVVNKFPDNKFYLSEMVDSAGNYVRIEESPSGNSKNGFTDGADMTSRAGVTAGPEGLSEKGDPSANAEPTPFSNPIVSNPEENVNEKSSETSDTEHGAVGAAEKNFSGKAAYQDLLTDDNTQRDRPGDVRPMEVPKKDGYGRKVPEFVGNAYGAEVTSDQMASEIEDLVQEGALGFDIRSNKESMEAAAKAIKDKGATATQKKITANIANGKLQDGDIEKAMLLYAVYANKNTQNAQDNAAELMVDLATMANMSGRNLQLFKMLRQMTPQGQRMSVQKTIDRYIETLNSKRGKNKQVEISIPQELWEDYEEAATKDLNSQTAKTEEEKANIEKTIYAVVASQIDATPMEKLNAWRYMAMLGNVKTQARNVLGNAAFRPIVNTKRAIGAGLEAMFVERDKRTKSVLGVGKEAIALRKWAEADSKNIDAQKLLSYSAKTGDSARSQIEDSRKIYNTKWLEATREFIQEVPEAADGIFKRWEYSVSLASFMKARGYTAADITDGIVPEVVLNEAREYAAHEALKATFNDMNSFSDFVSKRYKGNNHVIKALNILGEGILPFRRTPANVLVRGVEYSPANIVRSTYNMMTKVRRGEMSAATAIDQMASGLAGTSMMALGWVLASGLLGIKLVGYQDDEDKKNAGHQSYAIEIGNKSYTVDWAAPANLPLFVGANLYNALQDRNPDTVWYMSLLEYSARTLEPMLELSCLSSLNDLVQDISYADDDVKIYTAVSSAATSYLNQFIPTLFGQIEQATEPEKTQVYSDKGTALERSIETTIGQMTRKIPGIDLFQAQKYDVWGNREDAGTSVLEKAGNAFEAFISPSYASDISDDPVDAEIMRLNNAQDINVTAQKPAKTISYTDSNGEKHDKERLTAEQWEVVQKEYGQTAHDVLSALMENSSYEAMSDAQKAEAFQLAYDYAREKSCIAAVEGYPGYSDSWMEGIEGNEADSIIEKISLGTMVGAFSDLTTAWKNGRDVTAAVTAVERAYVLYDSLTPSQAQEVNKESTGRVEACYTAMNAGVDAQTFTGLYKIYYDLSNSESKPTEKANAWAKELQLAKEAGTITSKQLKVMKENLTFSSGYTVETEKFDQLTDGGLSADKSSYVMDIIANLKPSTGRTSVSEVQKAEALADSDLSENEKRSVMKIYMNDAQNENLEQMISKGYSAEEYAAIYRIYYDEEQKGGNGTKARTIASIREELGCSRSVAEAVYNIYAK